MVLIKQIQLSLNSIIPLAFELPPNAPPLFNNDGSLHWEQWSYSNWDNPISGKYNPFETKVQNLIIQLRSFP